jgi:hypothetical protein
MELHLVEEADSVGSLAPFLRGEGGGEALSSKQTMRVGTRGESPHPALRADLSPRAGRGELYWAH